MASRTALRSVCLAETWGPFLCNPGTSRPLSVRVSVAAIPFRRCVALKLDALRYGCRNVRVPNHHRLFLVNCSYSSTTSSSDDDQEPPQEAVLKAISEVSKTEGRVGQTTNVVIGGTVTDDSTDEWLALDQKVHTYPTVRGFTAIGTGGDDFVQSMIVAVESVIQQPIPEAFDIKCMLHTCNNESLHSSHLFICTLLLQVSFLCLTKSHFFDLPLRP